jgi:hypothetical protein
MELEEPVLQLDGVHTYLSVKVALRDAAGVPYGLCGISTDITHRARRSRSSCRSESLPAWRDLSEPLSRGRSYAGGRASAQPEAATAELG